MTEPYYPVPQAPPRKRKIWPWIVGAGVVAGICCGASSFVVAVNMESEDNTDSGVISNSNNDVNPPIDDVTVTGCELNEFGYSVTTLNVTNNSSEASTYFITVEVTNDDGDRLEETYAAIDALRPGQSTTVEAKGLEELSPDMNCGLLEVSRYSSE